MSSLFRSLARAGFYASLAFLVFEDGFGQAARNIAPKNAVAGPEVTQIDIRGLKALLKPNGKPRLVNFWATWCDPCREEFPDLVKLDVAYKGKIDFVTVTLDDPADINTLVPKFLGEMKAEMPAYLLSTPDENAAIALVSKDWSGNLPLTILYAPDGGIAYFRNAKVRYETMTAEIDKLLATKPVVSEVQIVDLPPNLAVFTYEHGVAAAEKDIAVGRYRLLRYGLTPAIPSEHLSQLKRKYGVSVEESGCLVATGYDRYVAGYNTIIAAALKKEFGTTVLKKIGFAPIGSTPQTNPE